MKSDLEFRTYFMMDVHGDIKIGRGVKPQSRRKQLQIANAEKLVVVGFKPCDVESYLHTEYYPYRLTGEWYRPNFALGDYISTLPAECKGAPLNENFWRQAERTRYADELVQLESERIFEVFMESHQIQTKLPADHEYHEAPFPDEWELIRKGLTRGWSLMRPDKLAAEIAELLKGSQ
jgi:hypothetical protein